MKTTKTPRKERPTPYKKTPPNASEKKSVSERIPESSLPTLENEGTPKRKLPTLENVLSKRLYVFGGSDREGGGGDGLQSVECYDFATAAWFNVQPLPRRRNHFGAAAYQERIWICGGCDLGLPLDTVDIYNPIQNHWIEGRRMQEMRRGLRLVVYHNFLYAIGGVNLLTELNSIEMHCPYEDLWILLDPSMNLERSYLGVAVLEERMLAVAGDVFPLDGMTMEAYDDTTNEWETFGPRISRRRICCAGEWETFGPRIYTRRRRCCAGEWEDFGPRSSRTRCSAAAAEKCLFVALGRGNAVSRYSGPGLNHVHTIGSQGITGAELVSSDGIVFRVGGHMDRSVLNSVYWYNWDTDEWSELARRMEIRRYEPRAVIVNRPPEQPRQDA